MTGLGKATRMDRTTFPVVQRMADPRAHEQVQDEIARKLDPARFLVLGERLAAGMTNFTLFEDDQRRA